MSTEKTNPLNSLPAIRVVPDVYECRDTEVETLLQDALRKRGFSIDTSPDFAKFQFVVMLSYRLSNGTPHQRLRTCIDRIAVLDKEPVKLTDILVVSRSGADIKSACSEVASEVLQYCRSAISQGEDSAV